MGTRVLLIFTFFFATYLLVVLLSDVSIVGFWTDIIVSILLLIFGLRLVVREKTEILWLTITLKSVIIGCSLVVSGLFIRSIINPFSLNTLKIRSFYFQNVNGRLFHAYFLPVGAYSGGYGSFWITETPKYFPIIECRVYWDRAVHHNFNSDTFEGETINNYEVVKNYIQENVIDKN